MEETSLDKIIGKFFTLFERFEKLVGKFFTWIIFQLFTYLYFVISFFTSLYLFIGDKNSEFSLKSVAFRSLLIYGVSSICYTLIFYGQLKRISDLDLKILKFTKKFYSEETIKLCFEPMIADWKTEYTQAAKESYKISVYNINLRYIYAFLCVIIQQSWIGKAFEIIKNLIK